MLEMNKDWWNILAQKYNGRTEFSLDFLNLFFIAFSHYYISPLCPLPPPPMPLLPSHHTAVMSKCPFPFFLIPPPPNPHPPKLSACPLSMGLSLFCFLVQFVHLMPHMNEVIWYLSFSECPVSLCIMFSRSTHTVTNSKIVFFIPK